jgi:hypothetical protein
VRSSTTRVLIASTLLGAALLNSPARASKDRVEEQTYVSAGIFIAGHGNLTGQHGQHIIIPEDTAPVVLRPQPGERFLSLEVTDAVSPVPVVYLQQGDATSSHGMETDICENRVTIPLMGTKPVKVWVLNGFCRNHNWGAATNGTIRATFSRN